jgi:hypothetical protein
MQKYLLRIAGVYLLALFLFTAGGQAQEFRATLTGQVTDQSGAVLKGASVNAVNNASGISYTAKTSAKGVYYIPYVLPGT